MHTRQGPGARAGRAAAAALILLALAVAVAPPADSTGAVVLQPGIFVGGCTLGFALDDASGDVLFAHAAHCGALGDSVSATGAPDFGVVVYRDNRDFSLIRVHEPYQALVSGAVKGHPDLPTGVALPGDTSAGDLLRFSGYGIGYGFHPVTQENRVGVVTPGSGADYCADAMIHWGDSGGPVVHAASGKALGIVSRLGTGCFPTSSLTGPTLAGGIERAADAGYRLTLRTA